MPDSEAQPDRFTSEPPAEFFVTMKISKTSSVWKCWLSTICTVRTAPYVPESKSRDTFAVYLWRVPFFNHLPVQLRRYPNGGAVCIGLWLRRNRLRRIYGASSISQMRLAVGTHIYTVCRWRLAVDRRRDIHTKPLHLHTLFQSVYSGLYSLTMTAPLSLNCCFRLLFWTFQFLLTVIKRCAYNIADTSFKSKYFYKIKSAHDMEYNQGTK